MCIRDRCVITEGSAEIEDAQGRKTLVKSGDAFIIPQGSRTVWRIEEYVKKYYLLSLIHISASSSGRFMSSA